MGKIVDTNTTSTNLTMYIQDDSSEQRLMVQYYLQTQTNSKYTQRLMESMVPGNILSCFGSLKAFKKGENANELPYLGMFAGHIVNNETEYKAHGLAAQYVSLYNTKGPLRDSSETSWTFDHS